MRLGFQTLPWGRRIDDLDHTLAVIAACGYEGVEFGQSPMDIFVREDGKLREPIGTLKSLKERLQKYNLSLIGLVGGSLEERMEFCKDDHTAAYLYVDTWSPTCDEALTCDNPYTLALHPHWFMPVRKLHHAEFFLEKYPSSKLQLIVDTAHFTIAEDDPIAAVNKHFRRLASVHLKNWKPDFGRWSHRYAHGFCIPDEQGGIVPLERTLETLYQQNFPGWVVVEQDHFQVSREETALKCAEWASQFRNRYFRYFSPNRQAVSELVEKNKKHPPLHQPASFELADQVKLISQFSLAPAHTAEALYSNITRLLKQLTWAEAVKLWSYNPTTQEICLLSAQMDSHLPPSVGTWNEARKSLTGKVINNTRVLVYDLQSDWVRAHFHDKKEDKEFLEALKTRWMIVLPIVNSSNSHHLRYVLTIFPKADTKKFPGGKISNHDRFELENYADVVSVWADYLTDEACSAAAGATNHLCGEVKEGVTAFVNALMEHIQARFHCENVTIWLLDESRTRLLPAGKTEERITWNPNLPNSEHCYRKEEDFFTSNTWREREMLFSSHAAKAEKPYKSKENPPDCERRELLTAPLARRGGDVLGVVRLHNKMPRNNGVGSTMFTDDDAAKLDAIIQAALPHLDLLLTQQRQSFALTRLAHELQNPLIGITGAADFLREKLKEIKITDLKSEFGADYIDDIFCYRDLMSRLIQGANIFGDTIAGRGEPNFQRTELATGVVMPVVKQLRSLLKKHHLSEGGIRVAQFQGVIPWLEVDRLMFQQVFFNLFVNAIKYHDVAENFRLEVKVRIEGDVRNPDFYVIEVEDEGIGLDSDEKTGESLFLPGARGVNVTKYKDASGMGVGLAVVRAIVAAHCGTVTFSSLRKPTRVTIRLPGELRRMSPKLIRKLRAHRL